VLAECCQSDCLLQSNNNKYLTVSPYVTIFARLLEGPEVEVTTQVRRQAYLALSFVLSHHNGTEDATEVVKLLLKGLADADRSVRLGAGYVSLSFADPG